LLILCLYKLLNAFFALTAVYHHHVRAGSALHLDIRSGTGHHPAVPPARMRLFGNYNVTDVDIHGYPLFWCS